MQRFGNELHVIGMGGLYGGAAQATYTINESNFLYASGCTIGRPSPQLTAWQRYGEVAFGIFNPRAALTDEYNGFALGTGAGNFQGIDSTGPHTATFQHYFLQGDMGTFLPRCEGKIILRTGIMHFSFDRGAESFNRFFATVGFSGGIGFNHARLYAQGGFGVIMAGQMAARFTYFPGTAGLGLEFIAGRPKPD